MRKTIAVSEKSFSVGEIDDLINANQLIFNMEYQRSEVWPPKKKQKLVDSVLRKYDISKIFLRQKINDPMECLDGQQRLRAINEFIKGEYATSLEFTPELATPKKYDELPDFLRNRVREYVISATLVHNVDDETTSDIFLRLQEGMPLNAPEKLNAIAGLMRRRVLELSKHVFFDGLGVKNTRFTYRYLSAQILSLELNEGQVTDLKYPNLSKLYRMYKEIDVPQKIRDHVETTLNFLSNSLQQDKQTIRFRADVQSIYQLASTLRKNYAITGKEQQLHDFILDFLVKVGQSMWSSTYDSASPYYVYGTWRSSSADSKNSLIQRTNVILAKFLEYVPDLRTKDPIRDFDYWQKLAIYYKDKGICQVCKENTPFEEGEPDHIIRHADGGLTIVENGRWLCKYHNRSISQVPTA